MQTEETYIWQDKKRTIFGLPLSFTRYRLYEDRLQIKSGFFKTIEEEVRLYRISDVTLIRSFGQRIFNLGTIHLCTTDKSTPELDIKSIKDPSSIRDMISKSAEQQREKRGVIEQEFLTSSPSYGHIGAHINNPRPRNQN